MIAIIDGTSRADRWFELFEKKLAETVGSEIEPFRFKGWSNFNDGGDYWVYSCNWLSTNGHPNPYLGIDLLFEDGVRGYILKGYRVLTSKRTDIRFAKDSPQWIFNVPNSKALMSEIIAHCFKSQRNPFAKVQESDLQFESRFKLYDLLTIGADDASGNAVSVNALNMYPIKGTCNQKWHLELELRRAISNSEEYLESIGEVQSLLESYMSDEIGHSVKIDRVSAYDLMDKITFTITVK